MAPLVVGVIAAELGLGVALACLALQPLVVLAVALTLLGRGADRRAGS